MLCSVLSFILSTRSVDFDKSQLDAERQIYCGQGPAPPNPRVVEQFQQVVSQLFQQVSQAAEVGHLSRCAHTAPCEWLLEFAMHTSCGAASVARG